MTKDELVALAKKFAAVHKLNPVLVCAVVEQESKWNPWVNRYEPAFETNPKYKDKIIAGAQVFVHSVTYEVSLPTEIKNRCDSWGLLQLLGQTAREFGAKCPLPQLSDPEYGLDWGCTVLAKKINVMASGNVAAGLEHYNGGADAHYADKVFARMSSYADPVKPKEPVK